MNELATHWTAEILRATAALSISAAVLAGLTRLLKISSPRTHRIACLLVLLQGWLVVHPKLEVPWGETPPAAKLDVPKPQGPLVAGGPATITAASMPTQDSVIASHAVDQLDAQLATKERAVTNPAALPSVQPALARGWMAASAQLALAFWATGVLATIGLSLASYRRFLRHVGGRPPVAPEWLDEWRQVLTERPGRGRIELRVTTSTGPLVCWTPRGLRVLVPESLWRELNRSQRLAVLRHELAHCRRGDLWKSLIVRLLAAPHWFNPFAWWAARRFDEAAEWACDTLAPRNDAERVDFAKVLLRLCAAKITPWSLTAAVGGRTMTARVQRLLTPASGSDSLGKKAALAFCTVVLLLVGWLRVEVVAREADQPAPQVAANEPENDRPPRAAPAGADLTAPRTDDAKEKQPAVVDASLIDALVKQEAKFATCHVEYVATQQPADKAEPPTPTEEQVEFARDGVAQRWFRKSTKFTGGVRTQQYDMYVEQDGKRAVWVSQHNWNGLNPPTVGIDEPRPESQHRYDAQPLFGLFPNSQPLSSMLKDKEVHAEIVEGDAVLQWTTVVGQWKLQYEVRLSQKHDLLPIRFNYVLDGRPIYDWRATRMEQTGGVWYAAEGEYSTPTRWTFKVKRFEIGTPLPQDAMRYVIPDGARVNDKILGKRYVQGRPVTTKTKPLTIRVRDVANRPIEKATVEVALNQSGRDNAEQAPLEKLTDADGVAHFDAVPDDVLYLRITMDDMRPASMILGDGQELLMYLTPRTSGRVIGSEGEKPDDGHVYIVTQALPMSRGEIETPPTRSRDSADVGPNGRFEFTQDLTLRRLTDPLLFIAYAEKGRQMAIKTVMPAELGEPLNFVLQPTVSVTAELKLPPGTPPATELGVLWSDAEGRRLGYTTVKLRRDADTEMLQGEAVGCLPPGKFQLQVSSTKDTEPLAVDFTVEPEQASVALGGVTLRPSKFASLRGQPAPELAATAMPPSELKPLSSLHGQVVVLNFWSWLGDKLNDHPEQTPFFRLPARFKDKPVYWISVHDYRVNEPDALAAKIAGMRKAIWGDGPAPFASLIDESEPAPPPEPRARTAVEGGEPGTRRGVTRTRYGLFYGLVLIDRHGRVVGSYSQQELEPALERLLDSQE